MDELTEKEIVVLAVMALVREVNMGGFHLFYSHTSVKFSPFIVNVLHRIGSTRYAGVAQAAIDVLEIDGFLTVDAINRVLYGGNSKNAIHREFEPLENEFHNSIGSCIDELFACFKDNRNRITVGE